MLQPATTPGNMVKDRRASLLFSCRRMFIFHPRAHIHIFVPLAPLPPDCGMLPGPLIFHHAQNGVVRNFISPQRATNIYRRKCCETMHEKTNKKKCVARQKGPTNGAKERRSGYDGKPLNKRLHWLHREGKDDNFAQVLYIFLYIIKKKDQCRVLLYINYCCYRTY